MDEIHAVHREAELGGPEIQPMVNKLIYSDIKEKGHFAVGKGIDPDRFRFNPLRRQGLHGCRNIRHAKGQVTQTQGFRIRGPLGRLGANKEFNFLVAAGQVQFVILPVGPVIFPDNGKP